MSKPHLCYATKLDQRVVIFEGDNQLLVNVLNGKGTRYDVVNWIHEIKEWEKKFEAIAYTWIPRKYNRPTDHLAKQQRGRISEFTFYSRIPDFIYFVTHNDNITHIQ